MHDFLRGTRTEETIRSSWSPATYTCATAGTSCASSSAGCGCIKARFFSPGDRGSYPTDAARTRPRAACAATSIPFLIRHVRGLHRMRRLCPENLIRLTGLADVCKTSEGREWTPACFAIAPEELDKYTKAQLDSLGGVMMKDETTCIRCGLCAARCPSHAITCSVSISPHVRHSSGLNPKLKQTQERP